MKNRQGQLFSFSQLTSKIGLRIHALVIPVAQVKVNKISISIFIAKFSLGVALSVSRVSLQTTKDSPEKLATCTSALGTRGRIFLV